MIIQVDIAPVTRTMRSSFSVLITFGFPVHTLVIHLLDWWRRIFRLRSDYEQKLMDTNAETVSIVN